MKSLKEKREFRVELFSSMAILSSHAGIFKFPSIERAEKSSSEEDNSLLKSHMEVLSTLRPSMYFMYASD